MKLRQTVGLVKMIEHGSRGSQEWAPAIPVKVYGYGPRPSSTEDYRQNRDIVTVGETVYAPPVLRNADTQEPVAIDALDRFELPIGGDLYEVDGEIRDLTNGPFGSHLGISISLKRVEG